MSETGAKWASQEDDVPKCRFLILSTLWNGLICRMKCVTQPISDVTGLPGGDLNSATRGEPIYPQFKSKLLVSLPVLLSSHLPTVCIYILDLSFSSTGQCDTFCWNKGFSCIRVLSLQPWKTKVCGTSFTTLLQLIAVVWVMLDTHLNWSVTTYNF